MSHRLTSRHAAIIFSALCAACSSEQLADDVSGSPTGLDDSGIQSDPANDTSDGPREVTFRIAPGSAISNAQVRITNLDSDGPVVTASSDEEGAAEFTFNAADGDEIRFQITTEERRYEPRDYLLGRADGRNTLTRIERLSCLRFDPGLELGFEASLAQLSVYNSCGDALNLSEPRLRLGTLGENFELVTLMPVEIGEGLSAGIELRVQAEATQLSEDVLFLDADVGPEQLRYALGLYAAR